MITAARNPQRFQAKADDSSRLRRRLCFTAVLLGLSGAAGATPVLDPAPIAPADVDFDSSFLVGSGKNIDISRFEHGNVVLPGNYSVDVNVKNGWYGHQNVTFRSVDGSASAQPCFTKSMLSSYGIDFTRVQKDAQRDGKHVVAASDTPICGSLAQFVPGASATYDASEQHLEIFVPQLYLRRDARGWVDPSQWQGGVDAALANYTFSSYTSRADGLSDRSAFLGLDAGLNLGRWRFRQSGSAQWDNRTGLSYHSGLAYAQHDLTRLKAQLTIGDTSTEGRIFDAVPVRGVSIASDDRMLPSGQSMFAPIVRGVANTNANVTIRQHGQIISQTSVAPGPFEISDLSPSTVGGDLEVTVTESDGRVSSFKVPFSVAPGMLRPGTERFSVVAGQVNLAQLRHRYGMFEGIWQKGLSNRMTAYAGLTGARGYGAALVGGGLNTSVGAFTADLTASRTRASSGNRKGQSLRLAYSKSLDTIGTNLSIATYRYSSSGYQSLTDAVTMMDAQRRYASDQFAPVHQRSRMSVNISQQIGEASNVFLQGEATNYWGGGHDVTFSAGYSTRIRSVSLSVTAQRTRSVASEDMFGARLPGRPLRTLPPIGSQPHRAQSQIMFTLSMPLGGPSSHAPQLSSTVSRSSQGTTDLATQLSGTAGKDNQLSYGVGVTRATRRDAGAERSATAYGNYVGSKGTVSANASHSGRTSQLGVNASGGIVVHRGGITLGQTLGESVGIVHAVGARGAGVDAGTNVHVDRFGYAIVPYLTPYKNDTVNLDPSGMGSDTELTQTSQIVAPRAGAVVMLDYKTDTGRSVLIDASRPDGKPLPFGAEVFDEKGNTLGIVGQGSQVMARGVNDAGKLTVRWGAQATNSCQIAYRVPKNANGYVRMQAQCVAANRDIAPQADKSASDIAARQ